MIADNAGHRDPLGDARHLGSGPRSFKIGRHVRYWSADLVLWLTEQTHRPQGDA